MRLLAASLLCPLLLVVGCKDPAPPPAVERGEATPASAPAPGPVVLEAFHFPAGTLTVPSTWRPRLRDEAAMTALHVMPALNVTCDVAVLHGHGTQQQAEEYLTAGARAYEGETQRGPDLEVGGHKLEGILVTKPKAFEGNADVLVEVYAAISGEDLLSIGVTRLERSERADEGRALCLGAFAQLTSKMPQADAP